MCTVSNCPVNNLFLSLPSGWTRMQAVAGAAPAEKIRVALSVSKIVNFRTVK
jgi:hypothetical protein